LKFSAHNFVFLALTVSLVCGCATDDQSESVRRWAPGNSKIYFFSGEEPARTFRDNASVAFENAFAWVHLVRQDVLKSYGLDFQQLLNNDDLLSALTTPESAFFWRHSWTATKPQRSWIAFNAQDVGPFGPNMLVQSYQCDDLLVIANSELALHPGPEVCVALFDDESEQNKSYAQCIATHMAPALALQIENLQLQFKSFTESRCRR
jgi:hypothetical protein